MARSTVEAAPEAMHGGLPSALRTALAIMFALALVLALALAAATAGSGEAMEGWAGTSLRQRRLEPEVENMTGGGMAGQQRREPEVENVTGGGMAGQQRQEPEVENVAGGGIAGQQRREPEVANVTGGGIAGQLRREPEVANVTGGGIAGQLRREPEIENVTGIRAPSQPTQLSSCHYGRAGERKPAHAGCIVSSGGRLLAIRLTYDGRRYDIPGGQTNWREPARCTAQREVLEETGYRVAPGRLLAVVRNNFHIYKCGLVESRPVRQHDHEVSWVGWLSREEVKSKLRRRRWRFPEARRYLNWI